jgi:hypothetical protein
MIHKINVFILSVLVALMPAYVFAASPSDVDIWLKEITKNVDSTGRTTSYTLDAQKRTIVNGTARDMSSKLLDYKPDRSAVGGVMHKRLTQAAVGGGVGLIGVAAVDVLLKGIGWIMEDGVYVKIRKGDPSSPDDPAVEYIYSTSLYPTQASTPSGLCKTQSIPSGWTSTHMEGGTYGFGYCLIDRSSTGLNNVKDQITRRPNPKFDPNAPSNPKDQKIPLTPQELADIMFGDYAGDPDSGIAPKNDGVHTGVQETMTADPNAGEGTKDKPSNPVSNDIDQKLDANPNKTTKDHKSTDSKGDEETTKEDGTKEQTKTETKTELPAFCNYAASLCQWLDWTQTPLDQSTEPTEIDTSKKRDVDDYGIDMDTTFNTSRFSINDQCPAPITSSINLNGTHSFTLSLEPVCDILSSIKPVLIGCGYLYAAFIVTGAARE